MNYIPLIGMIAIISGAAATILATTVLAAPAEIAKIMPGLAYEIQFHLTTLFFCGRSRIKG